ncbi:MAG: 4Fe-4S dicluster domain-containing protein [Patescibacteria group bacterium]
MAKDLLSKIFLQIKKEKYKIFCPEIKDEEIFISELENPPSKDLLGTITGKSWKYFLMPPRETILNFEKKIRAPKFSKNKKALFGMNIVDLKALEICDTVFKDDVYYQKNRKNILIVGFSPALKNFKNDFFEFVSLEETPFDIFIESKENPIFYAGSKKGARILKKCGLKFKEIKYSQRKKDEKVFAIKKMINKGAEIWNEIGEICLACGKCTTVCPTCYCFDLESATGPEKKMERCSGNCFYDDFTRIAGPPPKAGEPSGHKFLNDPKEKIFFWYYHKFVRVPHGYGLPGCVGCGRCTAACPVGIDIQKNIKRLLKK